MKERLEYLRAELRSERISTEELIELQSLADFIDKDDVELLEAAGVEEFEATKVEIFNTRVEDLISQIEHLIGLMPDKGDSSTESQKVNLTQRLNEFSYAVNGVEESDF